MGVNNLRKTVTRQRRDCDLNPGPSAPEHANHSATEPPGSGLRAHCKLLQNLLGAKFGEAVAPGPPYIRPRSVHSSPVQLGCVNALIGKHVFRTPISVQFSLAAVNRPLFVRCRQLTRRVT